MKILPIDKNRVIIRQASVDKITGKWRLAVDLIVEKYKEIFGKKLVSVYINGSVATGDAVENTSDIDTNVIVDMSEEEINEVAKQTLSKEIDELQKSIPFASKIELHTYPKDSLSERKRFQMKITGVCVYGKNYDDESPEYKLERETLKKFRVSVSDDIKKVKKWLEIDNNPIEIKNDAIWISKRLIRNSGTLVMWKGDFYTMDIHLLAKMFIEHYPQKKDSMETMLGWVANPTEDKEIILSFLNDFGDWLVKEDARVFE